MPEVAPPAKPASSANSKPTAEKKTASSLAELYPAPPAARPVDLSQPQDTAAQPPTYAVVLGQYVVKSELNAAKKKIENAGVVPVVEQGERRKEPMTRIYLGEFADEQAAKKLTAKLQSSKIESFTLKDKSGKRHIYSGSYHDEAAAEKERTRFASLGIKAGLKQVMVMVPTYLLTAGHFPTEEAARKKATELEKLGFAEVTVQLLP